MKTTTMKKPSFLELNLPSVQEYFRRQGDMKVAYLFGSAVCGQIHPMSDVDLTVLFEPGVERLLQFMVELQDISTREMQVTALNIAPPVLAFQAIRDAAGRVSGAHYENLS